MPAWPDAPHVTAFLSRARRRLAWLAATRGATVGLCLAALLAAAAWIAGGPAAAALAMGGLIVGVSAAIAVLRDRRRADVPHRLEARAPHCRNVLVTADEILRRPERVRPYIGARVCADAARAIAAIDLRLAFPARGPLTGLAAALVLAACASAAALARTPVPAVLNLEHFATGALIGRIEFVVTPPAYTGLPAALVEDPEQVTAFAGSRVDVEVHGRAERGSIDTATGRVALAAANGRLTGSFVAQQDGFVAIDVQADADAARRLVGVRVTPDAAPVVRITQPGRDLLVDEDRRTLTLEVTADDDLALASLRVTYTRVTGTGENFTFADGDVPLVIRRGTERRWTATAAWPLAPLALEPGDMVVYRALARDHRPGAPAAESDAFIVERLAPGSVAAEGFAIDDQQERYAISQQMVILKTERLMARRTALTNDALVEEAQLIAAEQRQVRAEFVFMMGGHIEDEEIEAAGEEEIAAGRLVNRGRIDLVQAIRAMSEAAASLTSGDLTQGLVHERQALAALQRAFTRSRYILRTLSERERIESSRRLTGSLADAGRDARQPPAAPAMPRIDILQRALAEATALVARADLDRTHAPAVDTIATDLLRVDAVSEGWRRIAGAFARTADALRDGDPRAARAALSDAGTEIAAALRSELARAATPPVTGADRVLDGALADAVRRGGTR